MLAGWCAVAAGVLTVTGLITLLAFFGTGSAVLGALNDLNTILMSVATVPVALALHPVASRTSGAVATIALGIALLLAHVMSFSTTLLPITIGNGLIGIWLLMTAALVLAAGAVPAPLGWLGIAGGAGLVTAAMGFPLLGREHPAIVVGGVVALIGLVGFYGWAGVLLLQSRLAGG
jgi:hypothetical protein